MRPWVRNILLGLCALVVIASSAYYWFFDESHVPVDANFALDIAEVRRLANSTPGDSPTAIEVEKLGLFQPPANFVVAGDGWKPTETTVYSYRVVFPHSSAIIDTGLNLALSGGNLKSFDAKAFDRVQAAMAQSSLILLTHEHADHIGGLASHPKFTAVLAATRLTREQTANLAASQPAKFPEHALDGYVPLEYDHYNAVAPGMVLIKSPGHTPGSQMVYVQTSDGQEFLFIGDVAWHTRNIETERERARFVTQFTIEEDRTAVFGELIALHRLHEAEPRIEIVPGHDATAIDRMVAAGVMKSQFAFISESR